MTISTFGNRVQEEFTTTGTGTVTLAGASAGFQTFSAGIVSSGTAQVQYTLFDSSTNDFEVGLGTYTVTGTTLSRTTIFDSSNSGSAVDFAAGTKIAFVTLSANRFLTRDETVLSRSEYALKDFSSEEGTQVGAIEVSSSALRFVTESNKIIEFRPTGTSPRVDFYSDVEIQENSELHLGSQSDLKLYHLGAYNYIDSSNVNDLLIRHITTTRLEIDAEGVELFGRVRHNETENLRPINIEGRRDATNVTSSSSSLYSAIQTFTPQRTDSYWNVHIDVTGRYLENTDDPGFYVRIYYYNNSDVLTLLPGQVTDSGVARGRWADRGSSNYIQNTVGVKGINTTTNGGFLTSDYRNSSGDVQIRCRLQGVGGSSGDDLDFYHADYMFIESSAE